VDAWGQLAGVAISISLFALGIIAYLRLRARAISQMGAEWREHPSLRDAYEEASRASLTSYFRTNRGPLAWWLVGFAVVFVAVAAMHLSLAVELVYALALAVFFTTVGDARQREVTLSFASTHGLTPPRSRRWALALRVPRFVFNLGFFASACFIGGLLALPFR
jgi:hypothetical protein